MARQQQQSDTTTTTASSRAEGQQQRQQGTHSGGTHSAGTHSGGTQSGGTQSAGMQSAGAHTGAVESGGDRERQRDVSRESGSGTGMRTTTGGRSGAGSALAGRGGGQASLLPAFMASPGLMASAFMSNPFAFAQAMSQEMDRLFGASGGGGADFDTFGQQLGGGATAGRGLSSGGAHGLQQESGRGGFGQQWTPPMELFQRGNELVVRADLPGLRPEDVQIEIEDGVLTLSGERRQSSDDRQQGFYRSERSYGAFSRSIALPEGVDEDQVQARFEHGELEVTVPLPQQRSRSRRVQIQSGRSAGTPDARGAGQEGRKTESSTR